MVRDLKSAHTIESDLLTFEKQKSKFSPVFIDTQGTEIICCVSNVIHLLLAREAAKARLLER